ncbi:6-phospho-beta-glucosidase [Clostridium sp. AL.422]|uniref:family 4 glycosyl hydrolase n=1 Tax=Clostridium TaxID=1485 RepID=UPI00293DCE5D|nr:MULTISPECIES: 6-phospho-beta-glucosidase [unclassified Clostridium]MDV4151377.1 6-phospho-beta-glucosidase [Clostridium sp. AL.422]
MKLTVLGGGGVRAPFLSKSLAKSAKELGITEIVFMDNDEKKLSMYGNLAMKISKAIDEDIDFKITLDPIEAVKNADYIITTLRVGQDDGRCYDEELAQKYGVLGQETTGVGGFAMALRSIPVLIEYCNLIKLHSNENSIIFNFTNPSGLVTQALRNEGFDNVYGICDGPSAFIRQLSNLFTSKGEYLDITCYGLNHLSYFRNPKINGVSVKDLMFNDEKIYTDTELRLFDKSLIDILDYEMPNEYLYFFYYNDKVIRSIAKTGKTRGDLIRDINIRMTENINKVDPDNINEVFRIYATHLLEREMSYFSIESGTVRTEKLVVPSFDEFIKSEDDGGYSSIALNFIKAYTGKENVSMTLILPNNGAISKLQNDDTIEITCDITKGKIVPRKIEDIPEVQLQLISTIKNFERFTVESIKEKNKSKAIKALMIHPLINSYNIASKIVDELLNIYSCYVGEWK